MKKYRSLVFFLTLILVHACSEFFMNGDLAVLAEMSRGDITISDPSVAPSLFPRRVVTNLILSIKAVSPSEVVSVEVDLSALGGGTVNLGKNGDTWTNTLIIQSENAGSLSVRFIARSKAGKVVVTNALINVFNFGSVYVATNGHDTNDGLSATNAVLSIQKGVDIADQKGISEILVSQGLYDQSVNGVCVNLKSGLTLRGGYDLSFGSRDIMATPTIVDGLGNARHVVAAIAVHNVVLDGLVIRNGRAVGDTGYDGCGGGILAQSSRLELLGLTISNNAATNLGGGIFAYDCVLSFSNNLLHDNRAANGGGSGFIKCSSISMTDSCFSSNFAPTNGGSIYSYDSSVNLVTNCFSGNTGNYNGGAISAILGSTIVDRCSFTGNLTTNAGIGGGAIHIDQGFIFVSSSCFVSNTARRPGGGDIHGGGLVILDSSGSRVSNCYFDGNVCTNNAGVDSSGGGIGIYRSSNIVIIDNTLTGNRGAYGGGFSDFRMFGSGLSTYSLVNNRFYSNQAPGGYGGAVYDAYGAALLISNVFSFNTSSYGGGISAEGGDMTLTHNILSNNSANEAGGLYASQLVVGCVSNYFFNNAGNFGAGAIKLFAGDYMIDRCHFSGNRGINDFSSYGGAIYVHQFTPYDNHAMIHNSYFSNNTAGEGGAVYVGSTNVSLSNNLFHDNISGYGGGAIYTDSGYCVVNSCGFSGNRSTNSGYGGGAVELRSGFMAMTNNFLSNNYADQGGGVKVGGSSASMIIQGGQIYFNTNYGIYCSTNSNLTLSGVSFTGNSPGDTN